jgi:hypothetical protein
MALADLLPFRPARRPLEKTLAPEDQTALARLFKAVTLAIGFRPTTLTDRAQFQDPPYDFDRIIQAIDTDSYIRQGFAKYRELLWKEGWEVRSENPEAVSYLYERINFMELAMRQTFQDFLMEVADQLVKFGNAFVVKSRGDLSPFFPTPLDAGIDIDTGEKILPVIGYELIPTETVQIWRDSHNKPLFYKQIPDETWPGPDEEDQPTWLADQVIHLYLDRKPGRAFGTPFMITVMDDVIVLRQMEEDIQNLVHRELFPLYKYKVGTEEHPADPEEIEDAANELANLRTEGGLVLPERHEVEVVGAEGNALDASPYLTHFKERVCVGLGLSPHHLGMTMNGGNRAVTDRLDIALYDKIKVIQRYFARMIEFQMFHELLLEGGYDPVETPVAKGISDRCFFKFREIDVDTQVKKETHEIQKYTQNVTSLPETRLSLGLDPEVAEEDLLMGLTTRAQPQMTKPTPPGQPNPVPVKPALKKPSGPNKAVGNIIRPANQHGRRTSPNIRHTMSPGDLNGKLDELVDLIDVEEDEWQS